MGVNGLENANTKGKTKQNRSWGLLGYFGGTLVFFCMRYYLFEVGFFCDGAQDGGFFFSECVMS